MSPFAECIFFFTLAAAWSSFNRQKQNLTFDFCASWPSGLLIEPTIGNGSKNPFCIRQSYVAKCPGRAGAAREVYRNFLRNGTILKYLDDNTVVILRPNSVIVTCMDFNESQDESIQQPAEIIPEGIYARAWVNCQSKRKFFG
jgi:hypothetical protein